MTSQLSKLIAELELGECSDALVQMSKPSIELVQSDGDMHLGCSKFGGSPDVPGAFEWPRHGLGDYRFIGQINLAEIPTRIDQLPKTGLLSFFYTHDNDGEAFWGDPGFVRVFRFDPSDELQSRTPPDTVRIGGSSKIAFEIGADVPPWPWEPSAQEEWPIDESHSDEYWDLRCQLHPSNRYLLGYPFNTTLAYDPTPGASWTSLLTLSSDDDMEWCWHDGDWLVTFVEENRLQENDFSEIKSDAG